LCKHASELSVIRGSRIADEYEHKGNADNEICEIHNILKSVQNKIQNIDVTLHYFLLAQSLEDPDSLIEHYIILRGIERFYSEYYTYPGEIDEQVEPDIPKLKVFILS
jgi:amyloid beta precursor protein binding protein 1